MIFSHILAIFKAVWYCVMNFRDDCLVYWFIRVLDRSSCHTQPWQRVIKLPDERFVDKKEKFG